MIDLTGRRALVGGSSRGIGRACAELLAAAGAGVTLVARDADLLESVRRELPTADGQAHHVVVADFAAPDKLREAIAQHVSSTGPIEILVNNTGGPAPGPIHQAEPDQFRRGMEMHLVCNQLLVQTLLAGMRSRNYGRVINIISTSVKQPIYGLGVSNTVRWAVAAWAKTLSREFAPANITVNNVLPGYTATERLTSLLDGRAQREGRAREEVEQSLRESVPMGRFGTPQEIAAAVLFLASPLASYITGINVPVDGGRLESL